MDFGAVKYVIRDGFVESFTRFDSDVCEQFLNVYELCVKNIITRMENLYGIIGKR